MDNLREPNPPQHVEDIARMITALAAIDILTYTQSKKERELYIKKV